MHILVGMKIEDFMVFYRKELPHASVTPKLHILEEHVVNWISQWKFGLGFHGEQGGESLHAKFNHLESQFRNTKNDLERLKLIFKEHQLQIGPTRYSAS